MDLNQKPAQTSAKPPPGFKPLNPPPGFTAKPSHGGSSLANHFDHHPSHKLPAAKGGIEQISVYDPNKSRLTQF